MNCDLADLAVNYFHLLIIIPFATILYSLIIIIWPLLSCCNMTLYYYYIIIILLLCSLK